MSGSSIPTSFDERVRSERASWLGSKASRSAAAHTRSRVSSLTFGLALSARDAVACDTPAAAATSASVGRREAFTAVRLLARQSIANLVYGFHMMESIAAA